MVVDDTDNRWRCRSVRWRRRRRSRARHRSSRRTRRAVWILRPARAFLRSYNAYLWILIIILIIIVISCEICEFYFPQNCCGFEEINPSTISIDTYFLNGFRVDIVIFTFPFSPWNRRDFPTRRLLALRTTRLIYSSGKTIIFYDSFFFLQLNFADSSTYHINADLFF